eukprot:366230-Chlamydomonas_euryale.AAC.19
MAMKAVVVDEKGRFDNRFGSFTMKVGKKFWLSVRVCAGGWTAACMKHACMLECDPPLAGTKSVHACDPSLA